MKFFLRINPFVLFAILSLPILSRLLISEIEEIEVLNLMNNNSFLILYFCWIFSIGNVFGKYWDNDWKLLLFRVSFIVYLTLIIALNMYTFLYDGKNDVLIGIMNNLLIICSLYIIFYSSKVLKSVELNRNVDFDQHIKEIFFLVVFIIGIWFIQPRINRLFNNHKL
jgi:hypothetical protein